MRQPDFNNILKVLRREAPDRPTLFEFFLNAELYAHLAGCKAENFGYPLVNADDTARAFSAAGYDYATMHGSYFNFPAPEKKRGSTYSLNDGAAITNREEFDAYPWPEPGDFDYSIIKNAEPPSGMKLMICGPGGVLENVISLVGYDNLALLIYDDPQLVYDIFEQVGSRLLKYYELSVKHKAVGLLMSNDDWGFNTQTMISPKDMARFVFPWHKKIVELAHGADMPAVLHSCGNLNEVMDAVIDDMKYDGKHSYEDVIQPVEDAHREYGHRIATLGGIDLNFIVTKTPEEITARSKAMLELGQRGYALGTGNSVPGYVPWENYFAMTNATLKGV
jgi:uroporphyrinogen decarboxylase